MTSNGRLGLALALVLVGAAFVAPAGLAQEDENETEEDDEREDEDREGDEEREDDEERSVEVETEGKDVSIELERETEPREDEVEMAWKAEEATFELAYESENETRETEDELEAVFGALAEYRDEDGDGAYDPGEEIVSGWVLGDELEDEDELGLDQRATWGDPSVDDVTREGEDGKRIVSTAALGGAGELTLRFLVFGDFVELNGTSLSPTGAKIDIVVEDYAFEENGTDLALFLETETKSEFEQDVDDEATGVSARNASNEAGPRLLFTWKDTAQVDGETRDVETTVLEEETETETDGEEAEHETERAFVLGYPRGDEVVHDPRAEVLLQSAAGADVPGLGAPAILLALASLAAIVRRGRA